jgi:N12 class adenine-specific DNA methylase
LLVFNDRRACTIVAEVATAVGPVASTRMDDMSLEAIERTAGARAPKEGSFQLSDGRCGQVIDGALVEVPASDELRALIELRDAALELLALESDGSLADSELTMARATAAGRYERYVATWGPLNRGTLHEGRPDSQTGLPTLTLRRPDLGGFRRDPDYLTVIALESYDPDTSTASPAPILTRRVNGRPRPVARVANAQEALAVSLGEGRLDLDRIAGLLGLPGPREARVALGPLIYQDPEQDGDWVSARDYLSGDVRARHATALAAAADDPSYERNVAALADATPPDLGPLDISVSLGAPWVRPEDIEAFVHEVLGGRVKVWHLPSAAVWKVVPLGRVPTAARTDFGTSRFNGYELVAAGLNGRTPIVWDVEYVVGRRRRVRNLQHSLAAQAKLAELHERFRTWVWEDADRATRLCAEYNRTFNSHVVRPHDGSQLTFPGMADGVDLWPWQRDIVARVISSPASLCGHAVGAGKTRSMICTAMTARRLGLATKPLIAVPAHLVEQVAREARQTYPFGRFLIAGEDAVGGRPRELLAARCATGDWDAVIMSHGMFSSLPIDPDAERAWLSARQSDLERQLHAGQGGRFGRAELRRRIASVQGRLDRLDDPRNHRRPAVPFERLGVDLLLIDEAHYFKRLPVLSRREGLSFGSSQRAVDLMLKAQLLRARRGPLPSLALFTGTPWSNSIAETFVWQSFLQPDVLAGAGVDTFDAWAAVFVDYETTVEVTPDGSGFRTTTRPSRMRNVPELQAMFNRCSDVRPGTELDLPRPRRNDATVVSEPSPGQRSYVLSLAARADKIRREGMTARPGEDNMLALCTDGRRAALDPRLVGVAEPSPKIVELAARAADIYHAHAQTRFPGSDVPGVLQLVFCDQGTPGSDGLQTYGRIRIELTARGVPAERVRWVHEATTGDARAALFADCRDGKVAVLIGSTDKLGVGTNVQTRLRAVHHADAPWRPSDIEQREGRALRPGNLNPMVDVLRYVTEGTFDAYMWQTLQRKAQFIEQLQRRAPGVRTVDDISDAVLTYAEVKALATGNPLLLEQAQAAGAVSRLRTLRSIDAQSITAARRLIDEAERQRFTNVRLEKMLRAAQDRVLISQAASSADKPIGAAVDALRAKLLTRDPDPAPIRAPWRGLGVELIPEGGWSNPSGDRLLLWITVGHRRVEQLALPLATRRSSAAAIRRQVLNALTGWLANLENHIEQVSLDAVAAYDAGEDARRAIRDHRFAYADQLVAAEAHLADINGVLEAAIRADGTMSG